MHFFCTHRFSALSVYFLSSSSFRDSFFLTDDSKYCGKFESRHLIRVRSLSRSAILQSLNRLRLPFDFDMDRAQFVISVHLL